MHTDIEQQKICLLKKSFSYKDNLLLPLHQNDDRSCFVLFKYNIQQTRPEYIPVNLIHSIIFVFSSS